MLWILFLSTLPASTDCVLVGTIENAAVINTDVYLWMNGTRDQCTCEMLTSNEPISGFNYFAANASCQQFYNYSATSEVRMNTNAYFVFLELPSISEEVVTTAETLST